VDSSNLSALVIDWHKDIDRNLPWKENASPYTIWVSEIILQQTQVVQGLRYYKKFIDQYPTVQSLAATTEEVLLKAWEGLGYNSRARNLHKAAQRIVKDFGGNFPERFDDILSLPGIGDYTASAIASFAYEQPHVAVDSNVERWVSRYYGIALYKSSPQLKKEVKFLLQGSIEAHRSPSECNQSYIDFGALICTAKSPKCTECPLTQSCYAYAKQKISEFPKVKAKVPRKIRHFHYLVITSSGKVAINKRVQNDIWQEMYEFPLIETDELKEFTVSDIKNHFNISESIEIIDIQSYEQTLTHRIIKGKFYLCNLSSQFVQCDQRMSIDDLDKFAFAGIVRLYIADNMFIFNDIKK